MSKNDVVHASIEQDRVLPENELTRAQKKKGVTIMSRQRFITCHILALGSGVRPEAVKEAVTSKIEIKR